LQRRCFNFNIKATRSNECYD